MSTRYRALLIVDCHTEDPEGETEEMFIEDVFKRLVEDGGYDLIVTNVTESAVSQGVES